MKPPDRDPWWLRVCVLPEHMGLHTFPDGSTSKIVLMLQVSGIPTHVCSLSPSWYCFDIAYDVHRLPVGCEDRPDIPVSYESGSYINDRPPPEDTPPSEWIKRGDVWWYRIDTSSFDDDDWREVEDGQWANVGLSSGVIQWPGDVFADEPEAPPIASA
jgi:hypothetical protein